MDREETIFETALGMASPQARAEYLRVACTDDPNVLERLQGLLRAYERAGRFLEHDSAEPSAPAEAVRAAASGISEALYPVPAQQAGEWIGRYKLLEKIGEGGFGEVWMAEQREPVKRRVAVKIIKLGMDTKAVIARFEAERQALAMMDHPNIAKVLDAGAAATGRPYFVMELVRGVNLTEYCAKNQLALPERLRLFMQVCRAIQHAHQKGIIHRDIKPSNILVTLHDGVPVPKVIDFGIAKATQQELTEKTVFTQFRQFLGTPAYISPEQAELSGLEIDTRSDIYSLGVLLYELLTGSTPFDTKELIQSGLEGMRQIIREREPMRPSTRLRQSATTASPPGSPPITRHPSLSSDLDWIVMKCLEKDRARRYETANGLAMDLGRHLNNEPVLARPPNRAYQLHKFVRRNKLMVGAVAAVAVALLLGAVASTWEAFRATRLRKQAQAGEQKALAAKVKEAEERGRAEASDQAGQRLLYAARMRLVQTAWEESQIGQVRRLLEATASYPDRGFEWYYWQRQIHRALHTLRGHLDEVWAVASSPDGKRIVTGSKDTTAKVWDAVTGKELLTLTGHQAPIASVAFSPDGRRILTGSLDSTAILWDAASGGKLMTLKGHRSDIWGVAFSRDGRRIATGSTDCTARIWDAESGRPLLTLKGHHLEVGSVTFSPDGSRLATASNDRTARIWDANTGRQLLKLEGYTRSFSGVCFSPDGQRLVTGSDDNTAKVWDASTGKYLFSLTGHADLVYRVSYSTDGARIATTSEDRTARVWDAATGGLLLTLKGHEGIVTSVAFSPDGRQVVTGSGDGTARVWDAQAGMEWLALTGHAGNILSVAFSHDGERILTASGDQTAKIWETLTGKWLRTITGYSAPGTGTAFSPDDRFIATASGEAVRLLDTARSNEMVLPTGHRGLIKCLAFSPDGRRLVTASADRTARFWEMPSRIYLFRLRGHTDGVLSAAFSPDGSRIVTASNDGTARVWDAVDGRLQMTVQGHGTNAGADSAHFSPDGKRILTSSSDGTVEVWDSLTGTNLLRFSGHSGTLYWADYSPDGRRIVTASLDDTAKLWDAFNGEELLTFKGHTAGLFTAAFAPNGRRIVTGSQDHTARIWQAASAEEVAQWQQEGKQAQERLALAAHQQADAADRERIRAVQDPGVIRDWLVLPPMRFTNLTGAGALSQEHVPGEARLRPRAGKWRAVRAWDGCIYFNEINRWEAKRVVSYAATYIWGEAEQTHLSLKVGSDDEAKIYLNGNEIYRRVEPRTYVQDQDEVTNVVLRAGLNVLVLKAVKDVDELTGTDWRCSVRFADAAGLPVKGIQTTLTPADAQDPGAIGHWLVLAPIRFEGTNGARALAEEQFPEEAHLHPRAGDRNWVRGTNLVWQEFHLDDYGLDFRKLTGKTNADRCLAYAVCYIESQSSQTNLVMTVCSDDQAKVYLNGKEIYRYEQPRAFAPDEDEVPDVELKAGINVLVFKVVNERLDWAGSIRLTDAAGQPVKGIRVTLMPP